MIREVYEVYMESRIAVFIDFQNIVKGVEETGGKFDISIVLNILKEKGRILVKRAYADWARFAKDRKPFLEYGVDMIDLLSYGPTDKNRTDVKLTVDAMEIVFTHEDIGIFAIISGDSDMAPLVNKLKEYGKYTIGIGAKKSTSEILVSNCDEFIYYEALTGERAFIEEFRPDSAKKLLMRSLKSLESPPWNASRVREKMISLDPSFNEKNYGYKQFKKFLEAFSDIARIEQNEGGTLLVYPNVKILYEDET